METEDTLWNLGGEKGTLALTVGDEKVSVVLDHKPTFYDFMRLFNALCLGFPIEQAAESED